jgi:hypothetical protein
VGFFKDDKPLTPKLVGPKQERKKKQEPAKSKYQRPQDDNCMGVAFFSFGVLLAAVEGIQHVV